MAFLGCGNRLMAFYEFPLKFTICRVVNNRIFEQEQHHSHSSFVLFAHVAKSNLAVEQANAKISARARARLQDAWK
jgi:hypothetical protein